MTLHSSSLVANPKLRAEFLAGLTDEEALALLYEWSFWARPNQLQPTGDWLVWLLLAGRGFGKTRTGAETVRDWAENGTCKRMALIAPTAADIRKVMIEGNSGILSTSPPWFRPAYESSKGHKLTWPNGAVAYGYSAEEPDRLRGPEHDGIWADEIAAWPDPNATWDMAMFGLRVGQHPRAVVTTTPRPIPIIRELLSGAKTGSTAVTRGKTYDNAKNLAPAFLAKIISKYEGTRLGRQELDAEVIEEVEGALWQRDLIEKARGPKVDMRRVVVAIDPAVSSGGASALTGIVGAGLGVDNKGYTLADRSGRYSPGEWAKAAIALYDELKADRIVAEGNQGGEMVRHTLQTERKNIPVRIVHASVGKAARAEPVAALSEQHRIVFAGVFPELEDQLCTWAPLEGLPSPDRLDAFVWAFTDLMLGQSAGAIISVPIIVSGARPSPT